MQVTEYVITLYNFLYLVLNSTGRNELLIMANKKIAHRILLKMLFHTATILNKSNCNCILLNITDPPQQRCG